MPDKQTDRTKGEVHGAECTHSEVHWHTNCQVEIKRQKQINGANKQVKPSEANERQTEW